MDNMEQKLIERIRESEDPEKMMDYIEELLFNPQRFQEELTRLFARRES
jgi:hypothetical protein